MNLEQHKQRGDMKVWLSRDEIQLLLEQPDDREREIAIALGVRCGLRSHEVLDVAPAHVHDTDAGTMLRVWHGKGDKFRETPMPDELATTIRTIDDFREASSETAVVNSISTTRSLRRWVRQAADACGEVTDDQGWNHLSFHDLRASWATQMRSADVDAMVVCDWGGWNDLDTFLEHYRGTATPEAQRREREKVDWL
jgi:integrase